MDLLSFIRTVDLTKVRIGERQRDEDEPKLLETIVGRGSGEQAEQGDSASGGRGVGIDVVVKTIVEDVAPADDYEAPGGPTGGGKSQSSIQRLLAGAVQNTMARGGITPTLPFVSSSVSTTPEREDGDHTKLLTGANLYAIGSPQRFVISSDSSDHSGVNIAEAEVDSVVRTSMPIITSATTATPTVDHVAIAKEKLVGSSVFGADSPFAGGRHPIPGGFSDCTGSDFLIGGIHTVIDPDSNLQKVYVPQWNVTNGSCLDDGDVCREMVDEFAPSEFFAFVRGMEHEQLFTEFNVGAARQMSLSTEANDEEIRSLKAQLVLKEAEAAKAIRLRVEASNFEAVEKSLQSEVAALKERNNLLEIEKNRLDVKVANLAASVKVRQQEVADLDAVVTSVKLQNDNLVDQDDRMRDMNDKFDKLDTDLVEMALHLEERFYPHLLTTIFGRRWLLTHGLELAIAKCLNSTEYLSTLGVAIELKSNKDVSIDTIMNLLRLEDSLAEKLGLTESQPHVDQLMRIKENIAKHRSTLRDVYVPLSEPLSVTALTGMKSTLNVIPATVDTTMSLSITPVSVILIPLISTNDYEVAHAEGGNSAVRILTLF
nr:hypothetical protein [Tanacetum cinerariifolium]